MYNLEGQVALVTGAGGEHGNGRAIAVRLAQEGADVIINDLMEKPYANSPSGWGGLQDVVSEIESMGRRALGLVADITNKAQVEDMVLQALATFGHIDILVNNAAARHGPDIAPVVDLEESAWDLMQKVNVRGTFLCSKAVARKMIRRGKGGKIIVISSLAGKRGLADRAAYCTSKFALIGFTQSLALELAPHAINVNAICPGVVDTERMHDVAAAMAPEGMSTQEYTQQYASHIPLGRVAQASDVADMTAFLASSEADYLVGLAINVCGGAIMD